MNNDIATIVNDPSWLLHRYDPSYDAFHMRRVDRTRRREATFLLDQYLGTSDPQVILARRDVVPALSPPPARRHYLFHSAFCCSTLLANGVDVPGSASVLKEPPVLNDLVGWARRAATAQVQQVTSDTLASLARPFDRRECVVIKPSNVVSSMASVLMNTQPDSRAILMYAPLETFVVSVAKKGLDGRLWVRGMFMELHRDGMVDFGDETVSLSGLSDLQIAALGWLAQQRHFQKLLRGAQSARYRTLRSDAFLRDPTAAVAALSGHFGLNAGLAGRPAGDASAFGLHSKTGKAFSVERREAEYSDAAGLHRDEVRETMTWARRVADQHGVALSLAFPLID